MNFVSYPTCNKFTGTNMMYEPYIAPTELHYA